MSDSEAGRSAEAGVPPGGAPTVWIDGRLMAADAPALLVGDRGFQLGDGLFETLRVRRGVSIEIGLHLDRVSGDVSSWRRVNRRFLNTLRKQFLIWRTLRAEERDRYLGLSAATGAAEAGS
jgi:branched-subunit amino acid aminotransferase/4-amino-4-deoxychorismate lyase